MVHILRTGWYLFFAALTDCQSGVWKQASSLPTTEIRSAVASKTVAVDCASDELLVGGGASCYSGSDERLKWSHPTGNGWAAACPNTTVTAYAICAHK